MTEEIRKRFEEAADKYIGHPYEVDEGTPISMCRQAFQSGAEYGYKEAISQAKEWLIEHTVTRMPEDDKDFVWVESDRYEDKFEFIARFEADMNKLWEVWK